MAIDLSSLNQEQHDAAVTVEGPLLLLAGAGTGKTRALTYRIAHMVENLGVPPHQILAITFTNKAAAEMRERLTALLGSTRGMWILTFHALCVRLLRAHATLLGYSPGFTIYDDDDSKRLVKEIVEQLQINTKIFSYAALRSRISSAKNELIDPVEFAKSAVRPLDKACAKVYAELERRLKLADALDFDDLLVCAWRLLTQHPQVLEGYQERFRYISIDEYQDTNHVQYRLATLLAQRYENIMVVGDDDQSIYSWRGADVRNILEFEKDYPAAKVLRLEQNYRSTAHILDAANSLIAHNKQRKEKRLYTQGGKGEQLQQYLAADERDEGRWIAAEIERLHRDGTSYDDMALFYRTNAQSRILEDMLLRAGVPYRIYGGTRFFDREEIRDLMAYLKLLVNPADDMAAKRVINKPRRGIGLVSIAHIEQLAAREQCSFLDAAELALGSDLLAKSAALAVGEFAQLLKDLRLLEGDLRSIVEIVAEKSGIMAALAGLPQEESISRLENVREFFGVAQEFSEARLEQDEPAAALPAEPAAALQNEPADLLPKDTLAGNAPEASLPETRALTGDAPETLTPEAALPETSLPVAPALETSASSALTAFMEWLALRSDLDTLEEDDQYVKLMTVHSAKGLEFDVVFIAGMEEGLFPHMMSLGEPRGVEEERRLAYVALTRARKLLYLSCAQQRSLYGQSSSNPSSRFINEIPTTLLKRVGLGSQSMRGTGWEKRGSRNGIYGSGTGGRLYGGRGGQGSGSGFGSAGGFGMGGLCQGGGSADRGAGFDGGAQLGGAQLGGTQLGGSGFDGPGAFPATQQPLHLQAGDLVEHRVFGRGRVLSADEGTVEVRFEKSDKVRKLLLDLAPLAKIKQGQ